MNIINLIIVFYVSMVTTYVKSNSREFVPDQIEEIIFVFDIFYQFT